MFGPLMEIKKHDKKCRHCMYFESSENQCRISAPSPKYGFATAKPDDWCGSFEVHQRFIQKAKV